MSNLSNMQRKIAFALGILLLFVAMYPYKERLRAIAQERDLGEATMGEVDTGSFMLKLVVMIWVQMLLRWTLPRFRYDQVMDLCWKYILPISIANAFVTGGLILLVEKLA